MYSLIDAPLASLDAKKQKTASESAALGADIRVESEGFGLAFNATVDGINLALPLIRDIP